MKLKTYQVPPKTKLPIHIMHQNEILTGPSLVNFINEAFANVANDIAPNRPNAIRQRDANIQLKSK
jgi:hypothetical protein